MKEKADKTLCPDDSVVKNLSAIQEMQEMWFRSLGWEDPLEEGLQPTLVFLPAESHGQSSLWVTVHGLAKSQI